MPSKNFSDKSLLWSASELPSAPIKVQYWGRGARPRHAHVLCDGREYKWCKFHAAYELVETFSYSKNTWDRLAGWCKRAKAREYSTTAWRKVVLSTARSRARKSGVPFNLVETDLPPIPSHCPVLGLRLERREGRAGPNSPSLDRIVPQLGYVPNNIQWISHRANMMKNDASFDELQRFAAWINGAIGEAAA